MSTNPTHAVTVPASRSGRRMALGRTGWLILAGTIIFAGAVLNWGWLTAIGAAPLILALAPCAVMCGLGLCMSGNNKGCASETNNSANSNGPEQAGN